MSWTRHKNSHAKWTRPRGPDTTKNGATVQSFSGSFAPDNQIPASNGYTYDKAGNLTSAPGSVTLTYNGSDQLTGRSGGATGSYTYAGTDQTELISQVVPGNYTYTYVYGRTDQNGLPILDSLTNSNGTSYLTHDDRGTPLAIKTFQGATSYYVLDGLGSPVAMINTSGVLQATYSYDPWGNVTANNLTNNTVTNLQPYRFAGGMLDRSTGYVKFGMRYYDPATGRFSQQDSVEVLGDPTRGNRYEYAGDNPINNIDPSGKGFLSDIFGGLVAAAGAFTTAVFSYALVDALGTEGLTGLILTGAAAGALAPVVVGVGLAVYLTVTS